MSQKGPRHGAGHLSAGRPSRAFAKMGVAGKGVLAKERGTGLMSESEIVCPKHKRRGEKEAWVDRSLFTVGSDLCWDCQKTRTAILEPREVALEFRNPGATRAPWASQLTVNCEDVSGKKQGNNSTVNTNVPTS